MKKGIVFVTLISALLVLLLLTAGCNPRLNPTKGPMLAPARDLTGTWSSALAGRGIEWTTANPGNRPYKWHGDVELILKLSGNDLTGTARVYNIIQETDPAFAKQEQDRSSKLKGALSELGGGDIPVPSAKPVYESPPMSTAVIGKVWSASFEFESIQMTWTGSLVTDFLKGNVNRPYKKLTPDDLGVEGTFNVQRKSASTSGQPIVSPTTTSTPVPTPTVTISPMPPTELPPKPSSLMASDEEYYRLYMTFKSWGFDLNTTFLDWSAKALAANQTSFWIGSGRSENEKLFFDRVGDKWKPRVVPVIVPIITTPRPSLSPPSPTTISPTPTRTTSPTPTGQPRITLKSDASTLAVAVGPAGTPADAVKSRLDTADTAGLTFVPALVGAYGTFTSAPPGTPNGTQVVNIPPGDGRSGYFKITFALPANPIGISLYGAANVDDVGRVFLNGNAISPSINSSDPKRISNVNATFSTNSDVFFKPGVNEILISDVNTGGGPSGAVFFVNIYYNTK